jgi:signal transduction histidine kinase
VRFPLLIFNSLLACLRAVISIAGTRGSTAAYGYYARRRRPVYPMKFWPCARLACVAMLVLTEFGAEAAEPKRILMMHSFGRDFSPWNEYAKNIRAELERQAQEPMDLLEASLISARFADDTSEGPFANYLSTLFASHKLDLVIAIGAPAASFVQRFRQQIFPATPMLITAVEQRILPLANLTPNDAVVAVKIDIPELFENILQVLPKTNKIAVIIGNSPIEKYWLGQMREELQPLSGRVQFTWFNELSFEDMVERSAALPPHSAIFFGPLNVDASGAAHEENSAVDRLHGTANAPIFTWHVGPFGRGIVGGPLLPVLEVSRQAASVAVRMLHGEAPSEIKTEPIGFGTPRFDWREMQRWGISEASLPAGSVVEFRTPTVFEQYKWYFAAAAMLCLIEAVFIIALLLSRRRLERERIERQSAEGAARHFSGRLINAQEDERSRLARELHDDVTQRLALLAIDAGREERRAANKGTNETMSTMREGLVKLSEDVHALSYRLHPSILDDLGLIEALKTECDSFSRLEGVPVDVKVEEWSSAASQQIARCLFRVAQEALRNIGRHARANTAEVSLRRLDNGLQLCVQDDGVGFDPTSQRDRPSLGLASMRERIYLLGGELEIESVPGRGTMVLAWVPVREERRESPARATG